MSKELGKPPRTIAETLISALGKVDGVTSCEVAGPGYLNVNLKSQVLITALGDTSSACQPKKVVKDQAPTIIEYSQPNIAKPLGIHHILSTIIGQALVNLHRHGGAHVISWNYMGDWGTQFGKLAVAYERWGSGKPIHDYDLDELLALYVRFHAEAEKDLSLEDEGRAAFHKLETGDRSLRAFWKEVVAISKQGLAALYKRLHVSFDLDLGESFYEDKMQTVIEEGKAKGVFKEGKEGALIVEFPEQTKLPPYLILKGDGATLYATRDLAQMRYRIDTYHPQAIYIVTDIAQKLHFQQLEETCRLLGWKLPVFENTLFGRMSFTDKSMSTRKGNILKLEDVIEEAVKRADEKITEHGEEIQTDDHQQLAEIMGVGSLVYGVLSQNRKLDMVFDWNKFLAFEGNSAPYLQYTHARARSVLRKAERNEFAFPAYEHELVGRERSLIHLLLVFGDVLETARAERLPHKLCNYLYDLCQAYNAFYNAEPILKAPEPARGLRLALTSLTAQVLKTGSEILTLRVPDRM